jgi:sporulation protein YlmC with PRC-barrel domain
MKLNSTQIRSATLIALLAGLSPAVYADTGHNADRTTDRTDTSQTNSSITVAGDTDRDSRAMDRPGHNSDTPGVHGSTSGAVYGQANTSDPHHGHDHATRPHLTQQSQLRKGSANELTGMNVKNRSGESLGRIKDFVIDSNSGQVVYAVVGSGGVAGIGEKLHAVPVQALNYDTSGGRENLILDIEASRWAQAPRLKKDRLSSLQMDQEGRSTFEYYGQTWQQSGQSVSMNNPVRNQGSQSGTTSTTSQTPSQRATSRDGQQLVLSSDLIGKNIRNGGQSIGTVDDVVLQLQNRNAAVLLDPDNDFAGSDQKYVVPLNKFTVAENAAITTTLSRTDFSSAQASEGNAWASAQSNSLYIWQGDQQSARRTDSAFSPSERGAPPVAEIRRAIQSDTSIAANQSDIRVDAVGDKLVLRGTVLNEDAKDKIEDRAEKAAPGWDIDNQLRVAGTEE